MMTKEQARLYSAGRPTCLDGDPHGHSLGYEQFAPCAYCGKTQVNYGTCIPNLHPSLFGIVRVKKETDR